ncbi:hypothetical protein SLEP1_g8211 [Rubroshorea leprosula]|uniref:Uncharacterized protein n=1 Tax=Rubroshorea leprosula TaxID=152421 RepID=A0AAV5IBV9_9ROSI|nr:hypothetical protein SLEP1_g8211 [Rubroshorea leprosula]
MKNRCKTFRNMCHASRKGHVHVPLVVVQISQFKYWLLSRLCSR